MESTDLNFADLDELAQLLVEVDGVRSANVDETKVQTPGVWIRVDGISLDTLAGLTIKTTLFLIVSERDRPRALVELQTLFNKVMPVLRNIGGPTGDTTTAGVVLPGSQTPLPALAVPLDLLTTQEE